VDALMSIKLISEPNVERGDANFANGLRNLTNFREFVISTFIRCSFVDVAGEAVMVLIKISTLK
jgi:hypothetical protein